MNRKSQKPAAVSGNAWSFSLLFAVSAVNYQRATSRSRRKSLVLDGTASERTAKRLLFFSRFPLFLWNDAGKDEGRTTTGNLPKRVGR
jgi:hypothetical protein